MLLIYDLGLSPFFLGVKSRAAQLVERKMCISFAPHAGDGELSLIYLVRRNLLKLETVMV